MTLSDFNFILQWWFVLFLIGVVFLPITTSIFSSFFDRGYIFAKVLGIIIVSYIIFVLGTLHLLRFTQLATTEILIILFILNLALIFRSPNLLIFLRKSWKIFLFEELLFFATLLFWSYIRSFQPDIQGLEKYMDFGFVNSILRSEYFPPKDMWFTPFSINYYYFGHLYTAVLTKLSGIPSPITYNLMLASLFAFTFTGGFSIGLNLMSLLKRRVVPAGDASAGLFPRRAVRSVPKERLARAPWEERAAGPAELAGPRAILAGFLTAFLVTLAGNLHAIYSFFKPYINENPVPFWQLAFSPETFPNSYWYPNATRFIYNTIHEFPLYSFVVSDLHGHVLDIPVVLLIIAALFSIIQNSKIKNQNYNAKFKIMRSKLCTFNFSLLTLLAFLLAVMYMTNAWDGIIYFLLASLTLLFLKFKNSLKIENFKFQIYHWIAHLFILGLGFLIFTLPFSLNFKPFISGIGILCTPEFLTRLGSFGPFIFEPDHCQRSPIWQLVILYGFFYFWVGIFLFFLLNKWKMRNGKWKINDIFILILIGISTLLMLLPELIYVKDIYPAHYRANTMFKLGYQAFIMLSISSGYIIMRLIYHWKLEIGNWKFSILIGIGSIGLFLVMVYPYFAINAYYGNLQIYYGLDGTKYLQRLYPTDYEAILWLNQNIKGQPVVLEAQGDSYTDFARVSANTGLPTVLGWTVHEWLWRGTYAIPAPRIEEVKKLYESKDLNATEQLIKKYDIELVFVGDLERQKYLNLNEQKFQNLGKVIYQNSQTKIYQIQ